jgi:hypothetical protein
LGGARVWAQVLQTRIAREATVLFIDIKGFTAGCAQMTVAQVRSPAATLRGGCGASSRPRVRSLRVESRLRFGVAAHHLSHNHMCSTWQRIRVGSRDCDSEACCSDALARSMQLQHVLDFRGASECIISAAWAAAAMRRGNCDLRIAAIAVARSIQQHEWAIAACCAMQIVKSELVNCNAVSGIQATAQRSPSRP